MDKKQSSNTGTSSELAMAPAVAETSSEMNPGKDTDVPGNSSNPQAFDEDTQGEESRQQDASLSSELKKRVPRDRAKARGESYPYDDDNQSMGNTTAQETEPGAIRVVGTYGGVFDPEAPDESPQERLSEVEQGITSVLHVAEDNSSLVEAELAPKVYEATSVRQVDGDGKEGNNPQQNQRGRMLLLLVGVVLFSTVVGLSIGLPNRPRESDSLNSLDEKSEVPAGQPTTVPPTLEDPYMETVAFRGLNDDWACFNTTGVVVAPGDEAYGCGVDIERSFPYSYFQSSFFCECKEAIGKDNPPTNEDCYCFITVEIPDLPPTQCSYTRLVETPDTPELFQITFDCSNVFYNEIKDLATIDCVGRDEFGNCFALDAVPVPEGSARSTVTTDDLSFCLDQSFENEPSIFEIVRGRYGCLTNDGFPFAGTRIKTGLYCDQPGGPANSTDCNCVIFLHSASGLFWDSTCQECQVLLSPENVEDEEEPSFQVAYDCSDRYVGPCVGVDANGTCIDSSDIPEVCVYTDAASCALRALELGLLLGGAGFGFIGQYANKGCYFYESDHPIFGNRAYFGIGARIEAELEARPNQDGTRLFCDTVPDNTPNQRVCSIFDEDSCRAAAEAEGLRAGNEFYPFKSSFAGIQGCYYVGANADPIVANTAFWNDASPVEQENQTTVEILYQHDSTTSALRFMCDREETSL